MSMESPYEEEWLAARRQRRQDNAILKAEVVRWLYRCIHEKTADERARAAAHLMGVLADRFDPVIEKGSDERLFAAVAQGFGSPAPVPNTEQARLEEGRVLPHGPWTGKHAGGPR